MNQSQAIQQQNLVLDQHDLPQPKIEINNPLANMVTHISENKLFTCAAMILAIITQLKCNQLPDGIKALRQQLTDEVIYFEAKAVRAQINKSTLSAARYILCAVMDEFILNQQLGNETTWKAEADWSQRSLISIFYHDAWGGEKFFEILENKLEEPKQNIEILELISLCLSMGFEGKYRILDNGHERLDFLQDKLFWYIHREKGESKMIFSAKTRTKIVPKKPYLTKIKLLFGGILLGMTLFFPFLAGNTHLAELAEPAYQQLKMISERASV